MVSLAPSVTLPSRALFDPHRCRFGRIAYFFRVKGDKAVNVHINWLLHRRSTRLGAHAQATALVKVDQCDNVDLLTVVRHVDVARVTAGMDPPLQGLYYE